MVEGHSYPPDMGLNDLPAALDEMDVTIGVALNLPVVLRPQSRPYTLSRDSPDNLEELMVLLADDPISATRDGETGEPGYRPVALRSPAWPVVVRLPSRSKLCEPMLY